MADPAGTLPSGVAAVPRSIPVSGLDLPLRIRRGLVSGAVTADIFARASVAVGTWEQTGAWSTIASAPVGGSPALFPLPADGPVSIVSDNASDTNGGVGARVFEIIGPGPSGAENREGSAAPWVSASVPMNGLVPVQTTGTNFWGGMAEFAQVISAGTAFNNFGTITISRVSDGKVLLVIPPRWGRAQPGRITVPLGWVGSIRTQRISWSGDTQVHWRLVHHHTAGVLEGVRHGETGGSLQSPNSGGTDDFQGGYTVHGGTTFWYEAVRDTGGAIASPYMVVFAPVEFYRE